MEHPLVSVVTITRNRGPLLKRCITSVLSQTYSNIEHIVVDGASDDSTDEVIATFKDNRLHFIKLDYNWPIKETLDYGISLCKGKYLTFLDSDDEYVPEKVAKQVRLIETLPEEYGFIYCWMSYYDNKTKQLLRIHNPQLRGNVAEQVVEKPIISGTPTMMFRIEAIRAIDGWKSQDEIGIISDWEMCSRACQKYKVDFIPESLVNVYINHGSVRQSESSLYYQQIGNRLITFHQYFLKTYANIFSKKPERAWYHYRNLFIAYFNLGLYQEAFKYYNKLLRIQFSISNIILLVRQIIKKLFLWK